MTTIWMGFLEGAIEGIELYAIWHDGQQVVGCQEKPLKEVLKPYQDEIAGLRTILKSLTRNRAEQPE